MSFKKEVNVFMWTPDIQRQKGTNLHQLSPFDTVTGTDRRGGRGSSTLLMTTYHGDLACRGDGEREELPGR